MGKDREVGRGTCWRRGREMSVSCELKDQEGFERRVVWFRVRLEEFLFESRGDQTRVELFERDRGRECVIQHFLYEAFVRGVVGLDVRDQEGEV